MRSALLLLALSGCVDLFEPDVGPPLRAPCADQDSDPDLAIDFDQDVLDVLDEYCLRCHAPDGESPIGLEVSGLDLSSYQGIRAGGALSGADVVVPGRPCESILIQKLGDAPPFGARMPLDSEPLEADDVQILHDWIAEGANEE